MRTSPAQPAQTDIGPRQRAWSRSAAWEPARGSLFPAVVAAVLVHAGVLLASPQGVELRPTSQPAELTWFEAAEIAPAVEPRIEAMTPPIAHVPRPRRREPPPAAEAREQPSAVEAPGTSAPAASAPAAAVPDAAPVPLPAAPEATAAVASHAIPSSPVPGAQSATTGAGSGLPNPGVAGLRGATTSGAAPVRLPSREWRCPWPTQAEYEDIDEQLVALRVLVAADGSVESTELVADPGFGFGAAARDCARRARFTPARDDNGHAVRALSPPIHVRFVR